MPDKLTTDSANVVIADQGMMYWRTPDGRVFAANWDERDYARKVRRGYTPLEQYGFYSASAYYMDHPHEPLFQAGGAREIRAEDLIALGYAQRPPLIPTCGQHVGMGKDHLQHVRACWAEARPVHFPQLEGVEVPALRECEYCGRDDLPTEQAYLQHQEVMHTERRQQEGLSAAIIEGLQKGGAVSSGTTPEAIAAAVTATLQALGMFKAPESGQDSEKTEKNGKEQKPASDRKRAEPRAAFPALGDFPQEEDFEEAFPSHGTTLNLATGKLGPHRPKTTRPEE